MHIKWHKSALADLEAIAEYIAADNPAAADRLLIRIEQSVTHLLTFPELGRSGRVKNTRELYIPNTPYIIPYVLRDEYIEILAVMHGARKWPAKFGGKGV